MTVEQNLYVECYNNPAVLESWNLILNMNSYRCGYWVDGSFGPFTPISLDSHRVNSIKPNVSLLSDVHLMCVDVAQ